MRGFFSTSVSRRCGLRALAGLLGAGLLGGVAAAEPPDRRLPPSRSLAGELSQALAQGEPLVVMASLRGCPWCRLVRSNYLAPMHAEEGLPVVQLDFRSEASTRAFDGTSTTHQALIRQWRVTVAPTVLFFGPGGQEVARRIAGMSEDFYAAQLSGRLRQARQALREAA